MTDLRTALAGVRGLVLDADGVIVFKGELLPGAVDGLARLTKRGIPFRIVTNFSAAHRDTLASRFAGGAVPSDWFITAASAAAAYTASRHPGGRLFVLSPPDALREFDGQHLMSADEADVIPPGELAAVVIGDGGDDLSYRNLNVAFRAIRRGAEFVAMHRNPWWLTPRGETLDAGAFVAGLEVATGKAPIICGKPSPVVFRQALAGLAADLHDTRLRPRDVAMVGDDPIADIAGARRVGLRGVLVLTGKVGPEAAAAVAAGPARSRPSAIAESLLDVVAALDWGPASEPFSRTRGPRPMTTESKPRLKITYATLRADNEELHGLYEAGLEEAKRELAGHHLNFVGGKEREGDGEMTVASPIDRDLILGHFARATRDDVRDAVAAARAAQPAWAATPWRDRLALIRKAADLISERQMRYAGLMAIEVGKNRLEALGEVEEAADLLRYYAQTMEDNNGYDHPMDNLGDPTVHTRTILRPHGVFAVISPFNFPMALAAGPTAAALMAGNTVVFKPSSAAPMSGVKLVETYRDAGFPEGVVNLVMGPGETVGAELRENPGIDGIVFTGSYEVGMDLYRTFSKRFPKPTIVEMGGKNPAVVSRTADLEEAAEGIVRSAFGFGGQKCSANSRVYVERSVHDELVRLLVEKTDAITIGDPLLRENWLGPIVDQKAVDRHQAATADARRDGRVFVGGERLTDRGMERGFYVEPTVVGDLPADHRVFRDELFGPFTAVLATDTFDEAIRLANDSVYGLTAGVYSEDPGEVQRFLDTIEAGVTYVNRRAGATTGAWPGVQAFGGWKGSGSTGKAGLSMYYVAQFLREQSHTVVD